jgi:uncharacterized repeat protein (TIGR03803 family)
MISKFQVVVVRGWHFCPFATLMLCSLVVASCSRVTGPSSLPAAAPNRESSFEADSQKYRLLFSFGSNVYGLNGAYPVAPLIDVKGLFYGTTELGGTFNGGTVFSLSTTGNNERVLYSFENGPSEGGPVAGLVNVNGTLYGTTPKEGKYNSGTVFRMSTSGANVRVVHNFGKTSDGANPRSDLIALDGKLYGTTYQGGAYGDGTVFSIRLADGKERVLHSFSNTPDGAGPTAGLIDVSGALYGTTEFGGSNGSGTVFSVTLDGAEKVIYGFSGADGAYPIASLINVTSTLYGTTAGGGSAGSGTVFSMSTTGTDERILHSFSSNNSDGIGPLGSVTAVRGTLYGTTYKGGTAGYGTIFRVTLAGMERVLHSFGGGYQDDGLNPQAGLVDEKGTLYGTTSYGGISLPSCRRSGPCDYGTVFALTP